MTKYQHNEDKPNVLFFIHLTNDFLEGTIPDFAYKLDFSHALENRYKAMVKEDPYITELINTVFYEKALDYYYDAPDALFHQAIKEAYGIVLGEFYGNFDIL